MGELAELLQWVPDSEVVEWFEVSDNRLRFSHEMADVLIYLMRLAQVVDIDLLGAVDSKLSLNESRYPADVARGSAAKYTAYQEPES